MKNCKLLVLALTGDCNFACRYCYAAEMRRETMNFETARRAISLAAAGASPFVLQFSGGEPMLAFPLIEEIVRYVETERIRARMQVQTNGSLLTEERARFLHRHRVGIGVSIDGRAAVHDCLRKLPNGTGSFAAVMRGMEVLRALRIPVGVTAVVSRENVRDLPGLAELAYYLGNVRRIGLDLLRGQGRGRGLVPAGEAETAAAVTALCRRLDELAAARSRAGAWRRSSTALSCAAKRRSCRRTAASMHVRRSSGTRASSSAMSCRASPRNASARSPRSCMTAWRAAAPAIHSPHAAADASRGCTPRARIVPSAA